MIRIADDPRPLADRPIEDLLVELTRRSLELDWSQSTVIAALPADVLAAMRKQLASDPPTERRLLGNLATATVRLHSIGFGVIRCFLVSAPYGPAGPPTDFVVSNRWCVRFHDNGSQPAECVKTQSPHSPAG